MKDYYNFGYPSQSNNKYLSKSCTQSIKQPYIPLTSNVAGKISQPNINTAADQFKLKSFPSPDVDNMAVKTKSWWSTNGNEKLNQTIDSIFTLKNILIAIAILLILILYILYMINKNKKKVNCEINDMNTQLKRFNQQHEILFKSQQNQFDTLNTNVLQFTKNTKIILDEIKSLKSLMMIKDVGTNGQLNPASSFVTTFPMVIPQVQAQVPAQSQFQNQSSGPGQMQPQMQTSVLKTPSSLALLSSRQTGDIDKIKPSFVPTISTVPINRVQLNGDCEENGTGMCANFKRREEHDNEIGMGSNGIENEINKNMNINFLDFPKLQPAHKFK